ncbi:MAG: 30S ribosome-binding factor RbfA [Actinobacteria bacterium]|nr:30S ribosome-binding factor RbfA [Actinomycetota bacterium]MBU4449836.1 30S ribosome-binding factor RbfA [Actinomycetota bacterium]MCG2788558.1 30S ribosome-binding factor RbfA [Actinomycetes bacterium]
MNRARKLETDLQREISFIINSKLKDPRIGFVTVTDVKLSPDYHYLDIFVSIMGEERVKNDSLKGLNQCEGFIKKNLKERFRLRTIPDIKFIYDKSIEQGLKITSILENLKKVQ